jgi:AcrR family transcriptional regulator
LSLSAYRLPPGRHGIPPEQVVENQRWRLLGAAAEVLAERGYARAKSSDIAHLAHVSRGTFYGHFENVADCLLAAYEMAADCVWDIVTGACELEGEWTVRLRAAIDAALDFLATEPALANLLGPEAPAGVAEIAAARQRLVERLATLLSSRRRVGHAVGSELPPHAELRLVEGALALLSDRIVAGEVNRLTELGPELAELLG